MRKFILVLNLNSDYPPGGSCASYFAFSCGFNSLHNPDGSSDLAIYIECNPRLKWEYGKQFTKQTHMFYSFFEAY